MNSLTRGALSTSGLAKYERPGKKQFPIGGQMKTEQLGLFTTAKPPAFSNTVKKRTN